MINEISEIIDIELEDWPGNCYAIVTRILEAKIFQGKLAYGIYRGPIHKNSIFANKPFSQHAWIINEQELIDPTRWAFEDLEPYIYTSTISDPDYDFGANDLRKLTMREFPKFRGDKSIVIPPNLEQFVNEFSSEPITSVSPEQLCWLANLPLDICGPLVRILYEWALKDGHSAFIPIDNRELILGEI